MHEVPHLKGAARRSRLRSLTGMTSPFGTGGPHSISARFRVRRAPRSHKEGRALQPLACRGHGFGCDCLETAHRLQVAEAYKEVSKQAALTVPTCFIIGKDGKIAWRERFGQNYIVERSDFGVQLEAVVGGKPLKSNGNRPKVEGEDVEEEAEGDFDMGF